METSIKLIVTANAQNSESHETGTEKKNLLKSM